MGGNSVFRWLKQRQTTPLPPPNNAGGGQAAPTPAGVGYARKPPVWMVDGDTIEIDIEGIGVLVNTVKREGLADLASAPAA